MSRELRMNKLFIQDRTATCEWTQKPKDNENFDFIIKWKPTEKNVTKCLNELKACHDNPMHHPTHILLNIFRANGFVAVVGWIKDAKD